MSEGAYCKHGVNFFHPEGCKDCAREAALREPVKHANGSHGTGPGEALTTRVKEQWDKRESDQ